MINWNEVRTLRTYQEQQIRQLAITEATTDLVATIDIDGFLINMNQAGYRLLELSENTNISQVRLASFYTKEGELDLNSLAIPGAILHGTWHSETTLISTRGEKISSSQVLISHKDDLGNIKYFSIVLRDIRPIRQAEEERKNLLDQLHQAKKMETVGRMAGGVAHDFNNIITVIMGYAEIGLLNLSSGEHDVKNEFEIILDSAHKAARLSNQLLEFSSKKIIEAQAIDINLIIEESKQLIASVMGDDVLVKITLASDVWAIKFDRSQLEQLILNLAINAKDALDSRGSFSIKTRNVKLSKPEANKLGIPHHGPYVELLVSDTGCGIKPEIVEYIYDPFFTTKDSGKGTGLGLSTVFSVIKRNNGYITVVSEVEKGTSFSIYLPRISEDEI